MKQLGLISVGILALLFVACGNDGGNGNSSDDDNTEPSGSADDTADDVASADDEGPSGGGGSGNGPNGSPPPGTSPTQDDDVINVEPDTCAAISPQDCEEHGYECGNVEDGCGGIVNCGTCPSGSICGGGALRNVCFDPQQMTTPIPEAVACENVGCGQEGNGRGELYACGGNCPSGEVCGLLEPFQCAPLIPPCTPSSGCIALGWQCGIAFDECGNTFDCAEEGLGCNSLQVCTGGISSPAVCSGAGTCDVCDAIPDCTSQPQETTITGRVITPGRDDTNVANQVGVPNAFVYVLANNDPGDLPTISTGIPEDGENCDRCDVEELGVALARGSTDALGNFQLEGDIPVGVEFVLVVKVGKFRRAIQLTLPESAACDTTEIDSLETRLPRSMADGLAVNIPRIAVTTGSIDAMECVFYKMGISADEFANGSADTDGSRIHLYRGGNGSQGARVGNGGGTADSQIYGNLNRMLSYDMVVSDCEGANWDSNFSQRDANGDNVQAYVNRGGRLFASHLSFSWLHENGDAPFSPDNPWATGLATVATWQDEPANNGLTLNNGTGIIALDNRPNASANVQNFADWMVNEGVTTAPAYEFNIADPRSQALTLGPNSEEFVHCNGGDCSVENDRMRTQQFSFNTPYGAPVDDVCGRVAYSGFHVAAGGANVGAGASFPDLCIGDLTNQEKVLLWMLFDLGACIPGDPEPEPCVPTTCQAVEIPTGEVETTIINADGDAGAPVVVETPVVIVGAECGFIGDGCGGRLDCGMCPAGQVCRNYRCIACEPRTCEDVQTACGTAECGLVGDGCGGTLDCGTCPEGELCGIEDPYCCAPPPECEPLTCETHELQCGQLGDGCNGILDCPCPTPGPDTPDVQPGLVCGFLRPNVCDVNPDVL